MVCLPTDWLQKRFSGHYCKSVPLWLRKRAMSDTTPWIEVLLSRRRDLAGHLRWRNAVARSRQVNQPRDRQICCTTMTAEVTQRSHGSTHRTAPALTQRTTINGHAERTQQGFRLVQYLPPINNSTTYRSTKEITDEYNSCTCTGWAKKTGPFLNVDNFATVSGRKARDMSKVCKFCLEKKCKTCIAMCLNILCLICTNVHYPLNYTGNNAQGIF